MPPRAVASLSLPGGQDKNISSIFPHFPEGYSIFPQIFFIFFLILTVGVGGLPAQEGPGYATDAPYFHSPVGTCTSLSYSSAFPGFFPHLLIFLHFSETPTICKNLKLTTTKNYYKVTNLLPLGS